MLRLVREPHRLRVVVGRRLLAGTPAQLPRPTASPTPPPPLPPPPPPSAPVPRARPEPAERSGRTRVVVSGQARLQLMTEDVDLDGLGLEIGASHNPLLRKAAGYNVRVADHLDQQGLVEKYSGNRSTVRIEPVDYVVSSRRLTADIPDRFDYIVCSHVAEHTVCLVSFLQDCETLLEPGGVLSLAVPDHRYCFDRFRERTSLGRVIDVYRAMPAVHTEGSVLEHHLSMVNKGTLTSWCEGAEGEYSFRHTPETALQRAAQAAAGAYVDTHNWVLTPNHFRLLLSDLHALGFIGLREHTFHDTVNSEFYLTLTVGGRGPQLGRQALFEAAAAEASPDEVVCFADAGAERAADAGTDASAAGVPGGTRR